MKRNSVTTLATVTLVALGCAAPEDPYYRLDSLRVLAIKSEPASPAFGETATLSSLVYVPPGVAFTRARWSWCPFVGSSLDGYPCLVSEAEFAERLPPGAHVPSFDLGSAPVAALEHSLHPEVLAAFCAGAPGQPALADCTGGFPVQVRMVVEAAGESITAVRELRLRFSEDQPANALPEVASLGAVVDGSEHAIPESTAEQALVVPRDQAVTLRASVPRGRETFVDRRGEQRTEELELSWFVECGALDVGGFTGPEDYDDDNSLEHTWWPASADGCARDDAAVAVVVRDERGGVSWRTGRVQLGAEP